MTTPLVLPLSIASYALLSSYCLCGGVMEHAAVFRGWLEVHEPRQLKALQSASGHGALYTYVVPKTALTVFNAWLAVRPPTAVRGDSNLRFGLWFGLTMLAVSWTSSFLVQVPLQLRIQKTGDTVLVGQLYRTTWARTLAIVLHGCSVVWILVKSGF
ncbi:hypothetical protein B0T25DRAFT_299530 [Lasiosphaeria hispida]|uniref:DUF1772-domain-containing protein n=1 Tax=Lasiosphaeria hispida TaxID=260671 RepID=A0AAJ0H7V1_9PEZI|nr:hypothetical protein B0T25DRAFT_299530 [Lasiosphaeria hispida]